MRICVNIKVWQRPGVFARVLQSIRDQETDHEIEIVCGLSPDDPYIGQNSVTALGQGCHAVSVTNLPLRGKANVLSAYSKALDWDYLMILGSDDVCGPGFFEAYPLGEYHAQPQPKGWGWSDLYMYEPGNIGNLTYPERFCYWRGYNPRLRHESIGAGRIIRRDIMEQLNWRVCGGGDQFNLDKSTTERLASIGVTIPFSPLPMQRVGGSGVSALVSDYLPVYLVDCKDDVSITQLSNFDQEALVDLPVPSVLRRYL